jgi:hypothetical protein
VSDRDLRRTRTSTTTTTTRRTKDEMRAGRNSS